MNDYYLTIDAGTSGGKAVIGNEKGEIVGYAKSKWAHLYRIPEDLAPYGHEFDPNQFWSILINTIQDAINSAQIDPSQIIAISATSQRQGCVFLDEHGKELYAGPNRDVRGLEVDTEEFMDNDEVYDITGRGLPFIFPLARLVWFQENEEEIYEKIKHLLTIDGWVNFHLTGQFAIDETGAAETLLYDITKKKWSEKILDEFEIPYEILPKKMEFGELIGNILPDIAKKLELKEQTPIFIGCADSQASLIGCGAINQGSLGVVAGSTMPIYFVIDSPIMDPERKVWTNPFLGKWVIESNAGTAGDAHQWFVESFLEKLGVKEPYNRFEELVNSQVPGAGGVQADIGPQIFNAQNMLRIPTGGFIFSPIAYMLEGNLDISAFARSVVENLSFSVRANMEQILKVADSPLESVYVVGGLARSKAFNQILADVIQSDVHVYVPEGASVAGFISGMIGTERFKTVDEAVSQLVEKKDIYSPNEDNGAEYDNLFSQWLELYEKSREED
ncbi:MAG: FGGY-family carbohydrate kinase [Candidatus Heimdallarchaeota archaeon]|nr:MAG: FGGY-family carbohydrate kinase [Candidatus Heimdallarchaeota archaeon]